MRQTERLPWRLSHATSAQLVGAPGLHWTRPARRLACRRLRCSPCRGASRRRMLACGDMRRGEELVRTLAAAGSSDAREVGAQGNIACTTPWAWPVGFAASWLQGKKATNRRRNATRTSSGFVGGGSIGWRLKWTRAMERRADRWRFMVLTKPCGRAMLAELEIRIALLFVLKAGTGATARRHC